MLPSLAPSSQCHRCSCSIPAWRQHLWQLQAAQGVLQATQGARPSTWPLHQFSPGASRKHSSVRAWSGARTSCHIGAAAAGCSCIPAVFPEHTTPCLSGLCVHVHSVLGRVYFRRPGLTHELRSCFHSVCLGELAMQTSASFEEEYVSLDCPNCRTAAHVIRTWRVPTAPSVASEPAEESASAAAPQSLQADDAPASATANPSTPPQPTAEPEFGLPGAPLRPLSSTRNRSCQLACKPS